MSDYELYVCGRDFGCKTMKEFDASGDYEAQKIATDAIEEYEKESGDYIYREYLYRNDEGKQVEIAI